MIKKALRIGQLITNAHPSDVRSLFQAYNITAEPTGKSIMDAYLVYGKPFLMKLFEIGYKSVSPFSSADGETYQLEFGKLDAWGNTQTATAAALDAEKDKGSAWEWFSGAFDTSIQVLTSASAVYEGITNLFKGGKSVSTGTNDPNAALREEMMNAKIAAQAAENANNTKTYLLIGAGLLVAVLVGMMFLKQKK